MRPTSIIEIGLYQIRSPNALILPKRHLKICFRLGNVLNKCTTYSTISGMVDRILADGSFYLTAVFT